MPMRPEYTGVPLRPPEWTTLLRGGPAGCVFEKLDRNGRVPWRGGLMEDFVGLFTYANASGLASTVAKGMLVDGMIRLP